MAKNHVAVYGSLRMLRGYCPRCKNMALIISNKYQCCDYEVSLTNVIKNQKRMIESEQVRRRPSKDAVNKMLKLQNNRCLYCEIKFDTPYLHPKLNKVMKTKPCFDHFIPYAYSQDNRDINFVCACAPCNGIKSSKIFKTVEEARDFVKYRRNQKGYDKAFAK